MHQGTADLRESLQFQTASAEGVAAAERMILARAEARVDGDVGGT
jgi:hypothetical protein